MTILASSEIAARARRRVAYRLLPFVFALYVVNYIDRVNVSFANLKMSADLGFSDRVYGLGVSVFYVAYVLFEISGRDYRGTLERESLSGPRYHQIISLSQLPAFPPDSRVDRAGRAGTRSQNSQS